MNKTFPARAIILDRQVYREFDSRISVYSLVFGRLDLIVKGAKRPKSKLAGHIEPMSEVALMVVKGKKYDYAGSVKMLNAFTNLKSNYDILLDSGVSVRLLKYLIRSSERDDDIYYLLKSYLEIINNSISKSESSLLLLAFILKVISCLGYTPQVDACLSCGTLNSLKKYFFNYKDGGLICENCRSGNTTLLISVETISLMRKIIKLDLENIVDSAINDNSLAEFRKIIDVYLRYNLNYKM